MLDRSDQRGDTLIEVILAVVILSMVTIGALSIMNRGIGQNMAVLEQTEVRSRINEQIELLNYFRDLHVNALATGTGIDGYPTEVWAEGVKLRSGSGNSGNDTPQENCTPSSNSFYIVSNATDQYEVVDYAGTTPQAAAVPGQGLWIEAVSSGNSAGDTDIRYVDMYIKACWHSVTGQQTNLSSTVRLYDK